MSLLSSMLFPTFRSFSSRIRGVILVISCHGNAVIVARRFRDLGPRIQKKPTSIGCQFFKLNFLIFQKQYYIAYLRKLYVIYMLIAQLLILPSIFFAMILLLFLILQAPFAPFLPLYIVLAFGRSTCGNGKISHTQ